YSLLLPMDPAVADFPEVNVPAASSAYLMQGQAVRVANLEANNLVRITLGTARRFVGIGEMYDDGLLAPERVVVFDDEP
ncbi:tRNA pseudouridine(55) synthase TruB, partial [Shewanella xiamenensis]|uniref:tRNA pseudouridine(55) synthase TruB n=1 Tax=Shewanella xiamenensis TaxID=332186 RepID=UPI0024A70C3E